MANITPERFETCIAFGMASLAVADFTELLRLQVPEYPTGDLLAKVKAEYHRIRDCFDLGEDAAVHALPLSILILAARMR